jgi:hypothetical protein
MVVEPKAENYGESFGECSMKLKVMQESALISTFNVDMAR